jgi:hypothetical protein
MKLAVRQAELSDLPDIIRMLSDDFLGQQREDLTDPINEDYVKAFREIESDRNNELIVGELDGKVIGTLQLTFTPSLSYQGSKRCTVESGWVVLLPPRLSIRPRVLVLGDLGRKT